MEKDVELMGMHGCKNHLECGWIYKKKGEDFGICSQCGAKIECDDDDKEYDEEWD